MAKVTGIKWTNHTVNPWIGCARISTGCINCYAETLEKRFKRGEWGPNTKRHETKTAEDSARAFDRQAAKAGERRTAFCASMADFFEDHPSLPALRSNWWNIIKECPNLDWLVLTKRSNLIQSMLPPDFFNGGYQHVHLGVTVENADASYRLDDLRKVPEWGGLRWTSMEPLVGPVGKVDLTNINWVIVGGESCQGNNFRPMEDAWVEEIMDQCNVHGSTFFFKQTSGRVGQNYPDFKGRKYQVWPDFSSKRLSLPLVAG
jgi:protein gp37